MSCTPTGYKIFLICCNVALLFIGVSILVLAIKMYLALAALYLINIPVVLKVVQAVIATGFFISVAGTTGICGACYECLWLLLIHLIALGIIVIMEFVLGVTLMVVKKSIENAIESASCNTVCVAALDTIVLDYALPSAGLMMTIIIVEALMIYCCIRLYLHIRDKPKVIAGPLGPPIFVLNVEMQNVAAGHPSPIQSMYSPRLEYMAQPNVQSQCRASASGEEESSNPPEYSSLPEYQHEQQMSQPPTYAEAAPSPNPARSRVFMESDHGHVNSNPV